MSQVETLTSVSVQLGQYTQDVVSIAENCLEGCHDDYYFFQYDSLRFVLITGDLDFKNGVLTADEAQVIVITRNKQLIPHNNSISAPFTGNYFGSGAGSVNGSSSFSYVDRYDELITYYYDYYTGYNISVSNSLGLLAYGSFDGLPHLIEGVQNYAFAGFLLAFGVIAWRLADRLFRRVY